MCLLVCTLLIPAGALGRIAIPSECHIVKGTLTAWAVDSQGRAASWKGNPSMHTHTCLQEWIISRHRKTSEVVGTYLQLAEGLLHARHPSTV